MNQMVLIIATQEYVIYNYRPEGKGSFGEIRMTIGDAEASVISLSDEDSIGLYASKAASAVKDCVARKSFPLSFTQAWY